MQTTTRLNVPELCALATAPMYGTFETSQTFLKFECSEQHSSTIAIEEPWVNTCCNTHSSRSSANSAVKPSGTTIPRAYRCLKKAFALKRLVKRSAGFSTPLLCLNFNKPSLICSRNQCNLISMCRDVHRSHKLKCGARITLQPNHNFLWLIDLMECKKKTVNQSTHRLQPIELCLTWTQTQSLLLPAQWPYQRSLKEDPPLTPFRLLKRYGVCDASLKGWRWTDLSSASSTWLMMVSSLLAKHKHACMPTYKNLKTAFRTCSVP